MKRQYLGDSKDSFKWNYLDFLVRSLGYTNLQIAWMMTPDDSSSDGKSAPESFPARPEIWEFCRSLRSLRDPDRLSELPTSTGADYGVALHGSNKYFDNTRRNSYFLALGGSADKVLFLDPDNGFEPERSYCEKHVLYSELDALIKTISRRSVITVFQHHRRKNFPDDFARIRERLHRGYSAAIFWHSLMFVSVSQSHSIIERICEINSDYAKGHPVEALV